MLPAERRARIVAALRAQPAVRVTTLSEDLGVSEITIRRDLMLLEQEGVLARTHGGAVRRQPAVRRAELRRQRRHARGREGPHRRAPPPP